MKILDSLRQSKESEMNLMSSWTEFVLLELEKDFLVELPSILTMISRQIKRGNLEEGNEILLKGLYNTEFTPATMSDSGFTRNREVQMTLGLYLELNLNRILSKILKDLSIYPKFNERESIAISDAFDALEWLEVNGYDNLQIQSIKERY